MNVTGNRRYDVLRSITMPEWAAKPWSVPVGQVQSRAAGRSAIVAMGEHILVFANTSQSTGEQLRPVLTVENLTVNGNGRRSARVAAVQRRPDRERRDRNRIIVSRFRRMGPKTARNRPQGCGPSDNGLGLRGRFFTTCHRSGRRAACRSKRRSFASQGYARRTTSNLAYSSRAAIGSPSRNRMRSREKRQDSQLLG